MLSRLLASDLGLNHIDLDDLMVKTFNVNNIRELYDLLGEERFRQAEYECLKQLDQYAVLSPGGGVLEYHLSIDYIQRNYTVIWIKQAFEEWVSQFNSNTQYLGNTNTNEQLKHIFLRRQQQYEKCADILLEKKTKTDIGKLLEECKHQLLL